MKGTWKGFYTYKDERVRRLIGFEKTFFEIKIDEFDGVNFSGTVQDDADSGGMEDAGTIEGKIENNRVSFVKRMPRRQIVFSDGEQEIREENHPDIYYSGIFDTQLSKIQGKWHFKKEIIFVFLWWSFPVFYKGGKGSWEMEQS